MQYSIFSAASHVMILIAMCVYSVTVHAALRITKSLNNRIVIHMEHYNTHVHVGRTRTHSTFPLPHSIPQMHTYNYMCMYIVVLDSGKCINLFSRATLLVLPPIPVCKRPVGCVRFVLLPGLQALQKILG